MKKKNSSSRRNFLKTTAAGGAGLILSEGLVATLLSLKCTNTNGFSPQDRPRGVSWVEIKTGLTDSTYLPVAPETDEEYALKLNKAGFEVSWDSVDDAAYYQIRVSKNKITNKNWKNAKLVATVNNNGGAVNSATVNTIQPSISGRNCSGCQACVPECPRRAITMLKSKAVIDPDTCVGCSRCYEVCTFNAVSNENLTYFYYFAVRPFTKDDVPAENAVCTDEAYKSRYINIGYKNVSVGLKWCGFCGAGCYILDPSVTETKIQLGACPVDAIYYTADPDNTQWGYRNMVHIDQARCISCGLCVGQCGYNAGHWSVRREIVTSGQIV